MECTIREYNIPLEEIPEFTEYSDMMTIILDTSLSFVNKFKILSPEYSQEQINYLHQIEEAISSNYDNSTMYSTMTSIENDIIINTTLSNSKKGELLNLTDIAKNSYLFWVNENNLKDPEPNWWWIIMADALGGIGGGIIGGGVGGLIGALFGSASFLWYLASY